MSQCRASAGRGAWHMMHEVNFATPSPAPSWSGEVGPFVMGCDGGSQGRPPTTYPPILSACSLLYLRSLPYKLIPLNCAFPPFQNHRS